MKIGLSGAEGSFSEEAARFYAEKEGIADAEFLFLVSVEGVLAAIEAGEIDLGIFPIENSNGGVVIEAVHAMAKHRFSIKKLFEIVVHQNLLALPGVTREEIATITSHDQALKQCRMYLKRQWPSVELVEYEDTAKAAADLSSGALAGTTAAIASRGAAKLYGLSILEESIQDLKFNYTTFIAATKLD